VWPGCCKVTGPNVSNKRHYLCASVGTAISVVPKENYIKIYSVNISAKGYICGSVEWLSVEAKVEVGILKYSSVSVQSHFNGVKKIYIYTHTHTHTHTHTIITFLSCTLSACNPATVPSYNPSHLLHPCHSHWKIVNISLCNYPQTSITSSFLGSNVFLSAIFSVILAYFSSWIRPSFTPVLKTTCFMFFNKE
jgi:hypothetical protein